MCGLAVEPRRRRDQPRPPSALVALSHKYVGFEDQFRGTPEAIRERLVPYADLFGGASNVLDIGCGRGEFLALLAERGIGAQGIDINESMVEVCRQKGLTAARATRWISSARSRPVHSGVCWPRKVVEHVDPAYLTALLDAAWTALKPGSVIVLETINPACWFAFFESYIRDITHVRPLHPDTLKYLLLASGFQDVDVRFRSPYPEHDKLQKLPGRDSTIRPTSSTPTSRKSTGCCSRTWTTPAVARRA
jgi:O-antigen chain-terminating methyltransferase